MKRPWNIVDHAVYSLVSYDNENNINMNICTYVSAISMKPKVFMILLTKIDLEYTAEIARTATF